MKEVMEVSREYYKRIRQYVDSISPTHKLGKDITFSLEEFRSGIGKINYLATNALDDLIFYGGYSLVKSEEEAAKIIVRPPAILNEEYETVNLDEFIDEVREIIDNFITTVDKSFPAEDLTLFHRNIGSLKVELLDELKKQNRKTVGVYDSYRNVVRLKKNKILKSLYHELFHMASNLWLDKFKASGFSYFNNGVTIGNGLNEGYTELLCKRYFGLKRYDSAYWREIYYALALENVATSRVMESAYMRADLKSLVDGLSEYATQKEMIDFLITLDKMYRIHIYDSKNNSVKITDMVTSSIDKFIEYDKIQEKDFINKQIEASLFLATLKERKEEGTDEISKLNNYYEYSKMFTIDGEEIGKYVYHELLQLYNLGDSFEFLRNDVLFLRTLEIVNMIGRDKLKEICFKTGIPGLIDELSKYLNSECVLNLINEVDKRIKYDNRLSFEFSDYDEQLLNNFYLDMRLCKNLNIDTKIVNFPVNFTKHFKELGRAIANDFDNLRYYHIKSMDEVPDTLGMTNLLTRPLINLIGTKRVIELFLSDDVEHFIEELMDHFSTEDVIGLMELSYGDIKNGILTDYAIMAKRTIR